MNYHFMMTITFTTILTEILLVLNGVDIMGINLGSTNGLVEASIRTGSVNADLNQGWKCADVIQNPEAVREELAARKLKGDQKVRKFIENCIKWGDGWRFKKDGRSTSMSSMSDSILPSTTSMESSDLLSRLFWRNYLQNSDYTTNKRLTSSSEPVMVFRTSQVGQLNDPITDSFLRNKD